MYPVPDLLAFFVIPESHDSYLLISSLIRPSVVFVYRQLHNMMIYEVWCKSIVFRDALDLCITSFPGNCVNFFAAYVFTFGRHTPTPVARLSYNIKSYFIYVSSLW